MTPFVSVLMSVYNGELWLYDSIQSVLKQTFRDFEFMIVNDGSTDRSLEIISQLANIDARIRVLDKPNSGLADSLNYGIELARGEWIARIDADDLCDPRRLAEQVKLVRSNHDLVLVGTGLKIIARCGLEGRAYKYPDQHKKLLMRLIRGGPFFAHSSAMYKTKIVRECGGYRARIHRAEDLDLWLRLSQRGKIGCVRTPLVYIRHHDNQISRDHGGRRQLVDSHVALVSYWLRQMEHEDPVENVSNSRFTEFFCWIQNEVELAGVFELRTFSAQLMRDISAENFYVLKLKVLVVTFICSPVPMLRWLGYRSFGSGLPKRLARKWIQRFGSG